jgi:hypothetical protein
MLNVHAVAVDGANLAILANGRLPSTLERNIPAARRLMRARVRTRACGSVARCLTGFVATRLSRLVAARLSRFIRARLTRLVRALLPGPVRTRLSGLICALRVVARIVSRSSIIGIRSAGSTIASIISAGMLGIIPA